VSDLVLENGAKKELYFNVFDFDLKEIAQTLINKNQNEHIKIIGGIDFRNVRDNPPVKEVFDLFSANSNENLNVIAVNSVGLNHQKILVRDVGLPTAAILFLSGNFTQSCIGPEGDAVALPAKQRPKFSIPNANHAIWIDGALPAIVAKYELKKTLELKLRGQSEYPISGSYTILGPRKGKEPTWIMMSFSPNGGMGDVNSDIYQKILIETPGRIKMSHFAFSSPVIERALLKRLKKQKELGQVAQLWSVGDKPFAMRPWSIFLHLSQLKLDDTTGKYVDDAASELTSFYSTDEITQLRSQIRVAPAVYSEKNIKLKTGQSLAITAKLHHKVFLFPDAQLSIVGTSFNPSANAEANNEQILIVKDADIARKTDQMITALYEQSAGSVHKTALKMNERNHVDIVVGPNEDAEEKATNRSIRSPDQPISP
jgi:hypothetical protein